MVGKKVNLAQSQTGLVVLGQCEVGPFILCISYMIRIHASLKRRVDLAQRQINLLGLDLAKGESTESDIFFAECCPRSKNTIQRSRREEFNHLTLYIRKEGDKRGKLSLH